MAKKTTGGSKPTKTSKTKVAEPAADTVPINAPTSTTPTRATTVPKATRPATGNPAPTAVAVEVTPALAIVETIVTDDQIREHAYFLWQSGVPGDPDHHWFCAETDLRSRKA